jgi:radical SAM superfamily enzyme YgiQ (UPF0313 family)
VLHLSKEIEETEFRNRVTSEGPAIVGFSATSHQEKYLIRYSRALKGLQGALKIAGGSHATLDPDGVLREAEIDAVCMGEGEIPLDDLLSRMSKGLSLQEAKGFFWRTNGTVRRNPVPGFVTDLDVLDLPDYGVFDRRLVVRPWFVERSLVIEKEDRKKYIEIMISRGCPHNCHYCCNRALCGVYPSSKGYFRLPSVGTAIRVVRHVLESYPDAQHIDFIDDLLIADKPWFLEFSKAYAKEIGLPYRVCGRAEHLTPDIVDALGRSGCVRVLLGLESGDEEYRRRYLNRGHTNAQIAEACGRLKAAGVPICTLNMIGLPFETRRQMHATLSLNRKLRPEFGTTFFFHPYKGTHLHQVCSENGLLKPAQDERVITTNYAKPYIKLTHVSEKQCMWFQKRMQLFFFAQTVKYRLKLYWSRHRLMGTLLLPLALARLVIMGARVFLKDRAPAQ